MRNKDTSETQIHNSMYDCVIQGQIAEIDSFAFGTSIGIGTTTFNGASSARLYGGVSGFNDDPSVTDAERAALWRQAAAKFGYEECSE